MALRTRLIGALLVAGGAAILLAYVTWPLAPDHGFMGLVGRTWLRGGIPYRDAFDSKGPAAYLWFAAVEGLLGPGAHPIRAVDAAMLATAALVFAWVLQPVVGRATAWGAAALWTAFVPWLGYENTAQPDGWIAMASAVAVVACFRAPSAAWSALLLGALAGAGALLKPFYLGFVLVPPLVVALGRGPLRRAAVQSALACVAALAVVAAMVGWFAAHGATSDLVDGWLGYTRRVYFGTLGAGWYERAYGVWAFISSGQGRFFLPMAVAGAVALMSVDPRFAALVVVWTFSMIAVVVLQARYFPYHWLVVLPPLSLLATAGAVEGVRLARRALAGEAPRAAAPAIAALLALSAMGIAGVASKSAANVAAAAAVALRVRSGEWYEQRFLRADVYRTEVRDQRRAAAWLTQAVPSGGRVGLWTNNPTTVLLAGCTSATRAFGWPLVLAEGSEDRVRLRREFMAQLERAPPPAFLVDTIWESHWTLDASLDAFPELDAFLAKRYVEARREGGLRLLALLPDGASGSGVFTVPSP